MCMFLIADAKTAGAIAQPILQPENRLDGRMILSEKGNGGTQSLMVLGIIPAVGKSDQIIIRLLVSERVIRLLSPD